MKNMDDWLVSGRSLEEVEQKLEKLMKFCKDLFLKLNPDKLVFSTEVEFGGTIISSNTISQEEVIFIDPKDKRIKAFSDMKKPKSKKEVQVFCGLLASLQGWFPALPINISNLRRATAGSTKLVWNNLLEEEYTAVKNIMSTEIRLSPYNQEKTLNLVIDGASSIGVGFVLFQFLDDNKPEKGAVIIAANSSMLSDSQVGYKVKHKVKFLTVQ